jgi:uncharacterized protein YcaQ
MPLLHGGQLLARVDPKRSGQALIARHVSVEPRAALRAVAAGLALALREAAAWVGCSAVAIERVTPANLLPELCRGHLRGMD